MAATLRDESGAGPSFPFRRDFTFPRPPPALGGLLAALHFAGALGYPLGMLCFWGALEKFDLGGGVEP